MNCRVRRAEGEILRPPHWSVRARVQYELAHSIGAVVECVISGMYS